VNTSGTQTMTWPLLATTNNSRADCWIGTYTARYFWCSPFVDGSCVVFNEVILIPVCLPTIHTAFMPMASRCYC